MSSEDSSKPAPEKRESLLDPLKYRFIVVDCETSGLDPSDELLEIAMIEINPLTADWSSLETLMRDARIHRTLHEPLRGLAGLANACTLVAEMHDASGLTRELGQSVFVDGPYNGPDADVEMATWLNLDKDARKIVLIGNSPHGVDVPAIKMHMPLVATMLSHRSIDVTSIGMLMELLGHSTKPESGTSKHRALDDAKSCLEQLRCAVEILKASLHALHARPTSQTVGLFE